MPFCPLCRSEYEPGTAVCADCNVDLVDRLEDVHSAEDMSDVYVCYDPQQADRLSDLLQDKGIHVLVRDRHSSAFPTTVGKTAQYILAVPSDKHSHAKSVIEAAINDGIISSDGEMLSV